MCEYIVLPETSCYPVRDETSFEQATLTEPLAIAVYAVEQSGIPADSTVAILGVGPVGTCVFHVLRTRGVGTVYTTDKREERLSFSRRLSPRWAGNPDREDVVQRIAGFEPLQLDVVYECSGDPAAIRQGVELLKPGGTLVIVGIPPVDEVSFPIHELRRKEISIVNVRRQVRCTQKAIDLIEHQRVNLGTMVTHRFPIDKAAEAFSLVSQYRDGVMMAVISPV